MKLVWKSRVIVFSHLLFCCVLFQNVKETQASQSRLLRFGQSVMSNCCIICFICANKAVIEMKRWRWARKRWRLHSVSHSWHNPSLHRSELSTLSAPWSKEGHVRAGWGLKGRQECRGNWCIEVMHLCTALCIVLWHETPPPHCEDTLSSQDATKTDYFLRGKVQVPACRYCSVSGCYGYHTSSNNDL